MTAWRYATVAWRAHPPKSRLKLALCLTTLPIIINAKASLPVNTFPEGVSFDTDSFPIAKGSANKNKIATATVPGQIVLVDQMQSTVPGLVGQIKGILTRQRYHYVTVFVDQFSGFSFVHLQKTSSGEETLDAKWRLKALRD
jgi:hypothetical protein